MNDCQVSGLSFIKITESKAQGYHAQSYTHSIKHMASTKGLSKYVYVAERDTLI